jgi:hypothetical protein
MIFHKDFKRMTTTTPLPSNNEPWIHNSSRFRAKGSTPSRRRPADELPYSYSSPNIHNLVKENTQPVPFAPRSALHKRLTHERRSSAANFPHPLHSNPTVASSGLTASVSRTDIIQPPTRQRWRTDFDNSRSRHNSVNEVEITVSRIPSPTFASRSGTARRYVSTPVRRRMKTEVCILSGNSTWLPNAHKLLDS